MSDRAPPRGRDAYAHATTITTRWADNDVYGHVNNTVYYAWFDTAVNEWLIAQGLLNVATGEPIALVVETGCRYFAPLEYPGEVDLLMGIERLGTSSVTYRLGVFSPGEAAPAAEGHFTHVIVDRATRRPVPIPDQWRTAFAALTPLKI